MGDPVCEYTLLPVEQCACQHCKPHLALPERVGPVRYTFRAGFDSRCMGCGAGIHEGDTIGRTVDDEYVCGVCIERAEGTTE
jgi:hypothetical protein